MDRTVRSVLWIVAGIQAVFAVLFMFGVPWATELWPSDGMTPMSNIFVGSIFGAAAASTAWCLWEGSDRGLTGIALDYLAIFVPYTVLAIVIAASGDGNRFAAFAVAAAIGVVFGFGILRWALGHPWRDPRHLPGVARWAFAIFSLALVPVGLLLVVQVPNILPWTITPVISTMFGIIFLGAAAYFVFALVDPRWENAGGQLAGFLAYDIVLIVPFVQRLPTIDDQFRLSLIVYTVVVFGSGIVAFYYLAVNRSTRLRRRGTLGDFAGG